MFDSILTSEQINNKSQDGMLLDPHLIELKCSVGWKYKKIPSQILKICYNHISIQRLS